MKKISVVITTFNQESFTWQLIDSIYSTARRDEIELIIIDNGSTDNTEKLSRHADVFSINPKLQNLAASLNMGIGLAQQELVFLLNNDLTFVTADWLDFVLACFENGQLDVLMPLMIEGRSFRNEMYDIRKKIEENNRAGKLINEPITTHLEMCSTVFRKQVFETVGLFDESMPLWYHHPDYFFRLTSAGSKMCRNYNMLIRHAGSASIDHKQNLHLLERLQKEFVIFNEKYGDAFYQRHGFIKPEFGPHDFVEGETVFFTESSDFKHVFRRLD